MHANLAVELQVAGEVPGSQTLHRIGWQIMLLRSCNVAAGLVEERRFRRGTPVVCRAGKRPLSF
jgi:hypothetical protein